MWPPISPELNHLDNCLKYHQGGDHGLQNTKDLLRAVNVDHTANMNTNNLGHEVTFEAALKTISTPRTDLLNKTFLYKCTNVLEKILFFLGWVGVQNFIIDLKSNVLKKYIFS